MKCPVCGKELDEKTIFCPNCGQAISQPDTSSASFNNYWNENNAASQKHITEQKEKAAEVLSEIRKKRTATFFRFVIYAFFTVRFLTKKDFVPFWNYQRF